MLRRIVRGDDIFVAELAARNFKEVVVHRPSVAEPCVSRFVAKIVDLISGNGSGDIGELDQQAKTDEVTNGLTLGRGSSDAGCRGDAA
jgi:hypothetical protein